MKNKIKCSTMTASFLLDALTSFSLITTILLIFLPILINQHAYYQKEIDKADMYRTLITVINHFNRDEINQGIQIEHYEVTNINQKLCIQSTTTHNRYCFDIEQKKN
ncbi:hypothetical protein MUA90_07245 [Staphylococcus sp. IVB6181]|uniref:hypothetical protein n=1 Tax=Staphylococcus sp. IVB6181 TaxID=2929481 RepID=UPI0021D295D3|nr:hypothetical protein [Staphylococcus sp. IVB6181]UXV33839.1 hypothetical protein MUA90_07245 [Staphylococcus sp. IVB6181]